MIWLLCPHHDKDKSTKSFNKRSLTVQMHLTLANITSKEELVSLCADLRKNNGDCPCCQKRHTFEKRFPFRKAYVPTQRLSSCQRFIAMTSEERGKFVEENGYCYSCLDTNHSGNECKWKLHNKCKEIMDDEDECGEPHHTLLHDCGVDWEEAEE